jgi:hypothetical protein
VDTREKPEIESKEFRFKKDGSIILNSLKEIKKIHGIHPR